MTDLAFYNEMLGVADQLISQYGMKANLKSNADQSLRPCIIVITDYMPRDAETQLANPTMRTVLFAAGLGDIHNGDGRYGWDGRNVESGGTYRRDRRDGTASGVLVAILNDDNYGVAGHRVLPGE